MRDSTQPISYFSVKVHRPYIYRTPISILICSAEIRTLCCKESFFGSKSKSSTVKTLPVSAELCEQVFQTKQSPYGLLTRTKRGEWKRANRDPFECHWLKTTTKGYPHFTITAYKGELVGDDPFIHQDLTITNCKYLNFNCIPEELRDSVVIWHKVDHRTQRFQLLGNYTAHLLEDFILVPDLGIGGAIQSTSQDGKLLQLDNGYLCEKQHDVTNNYACFLYKTTQFQKQAKPNIHTDLLEAHITVALEMQHTMLIRSWESICAQESQIGHIKQWMISQFLGSSAEWVHPDRGYKVEIAGEGLIISKCTPIYNYQLFWNHTFFSQCYQHLPVILLYIVMPLLSS